MTVNPKTTIVKPGQGSTYLFWGDLYTFVAVGEDTGGAYSLTEVVLQPQSMTPLHINEEDEAHYILDGEIEYQLDKQTIVATPGTFVQLPKGHSHGFKNIGSKPAKMLMLITPAGPEQFFAEVGQPVKLPINEEEIHSFYRPPSPEEIEKAIEVATTKYGVKLVRYKNANNC
ncbi:cupin 2 domain-containing protein [Scytonema sp. HK-05]|uniref:cupin domain-containing protein n=1 Tax=Scytonema sp. HK-05 TaxID=1137095 RepID=UPI000935748D|nr:cupin domain-containing protein [Scytonema sp. HK-05]OKH48186.1 cupin [Scytonema sp. HK-05]BAY46621.1 cupin 2 domain-containing protein [Scytonema sp. HK-05]